VQGRYDLAPNVENDDGITLTEYMPHGDLYRMLNRIGAHTTMQTPLITDAILWRIFDCLFRAVTGIACPPLACFTQEYINTGVPPQPYYKGKIFNEEPMPGPEADCHHHIHFDIDPSNVFIGEFDQGHHSLVPKFKVSVSDRPKVSGNCNRW
jgi:hypothetical protein